MPSGISGTAYQLETEYSSGLGAYGGYMQRHSQFLKNVILMQAGLVLITSAMPASGQELFPTRGASNHRIFCPGYIPRDTEALRSLRLCQSGSLGQSELYACQTVSSASGQYRIYFKGGFRPMAIAKIDNNSPRDEFLWQKTQTSNQPVCSLTAPPPVPANSQFIGAGVCEDINDQPVPCTVFRHKKIRTSTYSDYMTFYDPAGDGPQQTKIIYTGVNHDAIPAELEFQIGLNLLKTQCCRKRGLKYIEQAYALFPTSTLYRTTYRHYKALLSGNVAHQLSSINH